VIILDEVEDDRFSSANPLTSAKSCDQPHEVEGDRFLSPNPLVTARPVCLHACTRLDASFSVSAGGANRIDFGGFLGDFLSNMPAYLSDTDRKLFVSGPISIKSTANPATVLYRLMAESKADGQILSAEKVRVAASVRYTSSPALPRPPSLYHQDQRYAAPRRSRQHSRRVRSA
jgi:hypothetical protein